MSASLMNRLTLVAGIVLAATSIAAAQDDKPVTPPDSYRVVMENDRMRMIEVHVKPHSKVNVDSMPNRERFLYMLSDGALILAPPGKTPYEFALHAGETAVFPAVSPTVENDTNSAVRALMVEIKEPMRSASAGRAKAGKHTRIVSIARGKARGKVAAARGKAKQVARSRPQAAVKVSGKTPLNLRKTNSKPAKAVTGRGRANNT